MLTKISIAEIDEIVKGSLRSKAEARLADRPGVQEWYAVCDDCGEVVTVQAESAQAARQVAMGRGWLFYERPDGEQRAFCPGCREARTGSLRKRLDRVARERQEAF